MLLTLADRSCTASPLPLLSAAEGRATGIRLPRPDHHRVRAGIYVPAATWRALPSWQRYHVRVHAFARSHPGSILCLESAAVLHGVPLFGHTRDSHVYDPARRTSTRFGDVAVHTSTDAREVVEVGGIPVTSLLDTVVDLARVMPPAQALAAVDASVSPAQGGSLDLVALGERATARRTSRGDATLRAVWPLADPRIESPHESVSHAVIAWSGFEHPELQTVFRYEGHRDRVDFVFPTRRAIGEADGWGKYGLENPAEAAARLAEEKRREDRLRRHGHPFGRWEPSEVWRAHPVCQVLRAMGVPLVRPPRPALLATLRPLSPRQRRDENRHSA